MRDTPLPAAIARCDALRGFSRNVRLAFLFHRAITNADGQVGRLAGPDAHSWRQGPPPLAVKVRSTKTYNVKSMAADPAMVGPKL
jgi:hypothetical protein